MKRSLLACVLLVSISCFAASDGSPQNYYDYDGPSYRGARPMQPVAKGSPKRGLVVDGIGSGAGADRHGGHFITDEAGSGVAQGSAQPALPPNMDRGVKDLEAGMEDLRAYTAVMAAHIQQNGLRGFLAIPPDIRDQGQAVGRKIGGGINGITKDVAHDMIVPEKH